MLPSRTGLQGQSIVLYETQKVVMVEMMGQSPSNFHLLANTRMDQTPIGNMESAISSWGEVWCCAHARVGEGRTWTHEIYGAGSGYIH